MQKTSRRVLALVLALVMALSVFSISAAAVNTDYRADYQSETHTVFKHMEQTLAPGVEYYNNYAYSSDGKQMVYYVTTADVNRDDVVVQVSYKDMQCDTYGMSKLSEQVDAANAKFSDPSNPEFISENYAVVSATNGDGYNMTTGEPGGCLVMNGKIKKEWNKDASSEMFFAILNDGRAVISDSVDEWNAYKVDPGIKEAIDSFGTSAKLVWDGEDVTANASGSYNTDRHSRTMFGVTADGKVVQAVLDGRQEPFSCGGTMHELAQIMIEAGCVRAFNCDGGGSTTFMARTLGDETAKVVNRPSDGSPRSISNGLIIATTTTPSDKFERVSISVADEFITPGTDTELTFAGVSPAGTVAEIPAEVTYTATLGSVVDGKFVSDGTAGDAVITAEYQGKKVGTATVHVVVPESISFTAENFTIPYGKSAELSIEAKYGLNDVKTKGSDFTFTVENPAAGTIDGFTFTAADESDIASTSVTAVFNGTELSTTAGLVFGKGSEVIFDFEDGTTNGFNLNYSGYNYYLPRSKVFVATEENGKVHSGNYSLGLNIDYSNSQESGYQMIAAYQGKVSGDAHYYEGALKLGTWIYIPDEYVGLWVRWTVTPISGITENEETGEKSYTLSSITPQTMDGTAGGTGVVYSFDESGWHYLYADLSQYKGLAWRDFYYVMQFYISDRDGASYGYYAKNQHNINGDFTVYLDDITVDYSTVVEDRDAPVFGSVKVSDEGPHSNEAYAFSNGYVSEGYSSLGFIADVNEYSATNASGINAASAQAYIDGNPVDTTYSTGKIFTNGEYDFAEGQHSVKFVIYDNAGNRASATRTFSVTGVAKEEPIKVVPHDASLDRILHGSLYWVDVVAAQAEKVDTVTTSLNLDSMSKWELDHMTVADGFEASYKIVDAGDKIAEITIKNNGSNLAGEQALVSIPIRAWYLDNSNKRSPLNNSTKEWTYAEFKASKEFWPVATEVRVQQGAVSYTDGTSDYFTGENVFVWSESWANYANMNATAEGKAYFNAWDGGHNHDAELTVTKEAKAPTCTENGWTEELSCATCNSVVTWSKLIPATGHDFELDLDKGAIVCKTCGEVDTSFTGVFENNGKYYYAKFGVLDSGWIMVDDDYYYFDKETFEGKDGVVSNHDVMNSSNTFTYTFENGKLVHGEWVKLADGTRYYYGPNYYAGIFATIDGNTYYFDKKGYYLTGYQLLTTGSNSHQKKWHFFDENGIDQVPLNGLHQIEGDLYYLEDGWPTHKGLIKEGDDYYYIRSNGIAAVDCACYAYVTNCDLPADQTYEFGADGKMIIPEPDPAKNGIVDGYYYENDEIVYAGLIKIDGDYYYVRSTGLVATNGTYYAYKTSCDLSANREYKFDENGKMIDPPAPYEGVKNGIVDGYYYENDEIVYAGLIKLDGDYYYIRSAGNVAKNGSYYAYKTSCDLPADTRYEFDADGKMINPYTYYLVGGMNDWTNMQNEYKFVKNTASDANEYMLLGVKIAAETELKVQANNNAWYPDNAANLTIHDAGIYDIYFRPDYSGDSAWYNGCIFTSKVGDIPAAKNGIIDGYYYENDQIVYAGLIKLNDDYYYVRSSGIVATNGTYYAYKTSCDLPADREYKFDEEGKMINPPTPYVGVKNGIVDGYYYENDQIVYKGLTKIGEDYYYIRTTGIVAKNGKFYAYKTSCDLPADTTYTFDADGKMIR